MQKKRQVIGLCGSHRVGKTTLATTFARERGFAFVQTRTGDVFQKHGLRPDMTLDFATRLWIQHEVLAEAERIWQAQSLSFITDRTPIDFIAYTLADIQGTTQVDFTTLSRYIAACLEVTAKVFNLLVVVQPGIPLVFAENKAALNAAYIEHLNTLILGLCHDERLQCTVSVLPRTVVELQARCAALQDEITCL